MARRLAALTQVEPNVLAKVNPSNIFIGIGGSLLRFRTMSTEIAAARRGIEPLTNLPVMTEKARHWKHLAMERATVTHDPATRATGAACESISGLVSVTLMRTMVFRNWGLVNTSRGTSCMS